MINMHDGRWGHRKYPWADYPIESRQFEAMQSRVLKAAQANAKKKLNEKADHND